LVLLLSIRSDRHQAEGWIESSKIIRIGSDGLLKGSASADHHVGIHDIGCTAGRKESAHVGGVNPVERYYVGGWLPEQPGQTNLALGLADSLSQSTRGNGDTGSGFPGTGQQDQD
jgi:hypothetical protein